MIRWAVFDIGGVVIEISPQATIKEIARISGLPISGVSELYTFSLTKSSEARSPSEIFQLGHISEEQYLNLLLQNFIINSTPEEVVAAELLTLGPDIEPTIRIIGELKRHGVKIACFSNTHKIHWDALSKSRSWFGFLDDIFTSHTSALAKPDPNVFKLMQRKLGVREQEFIFIDDIERNVEAAKQSGWHGIHFTSAANLERELLNFGLFTKA
jgi:epoxide hydrolase-like predicted phosphatase